MKTKKPKKIHPVTGCRMDTIMGDWLIAEGRLQQYVETGWKIVEAGELPRVQAQSAEIIAKASQQPYVVQDGIAGINISGPTTKLPTSMQAIFGGTSTLHVRKSLKDILAKFQAGEVKALFVEIDSPGGTVDGNAELAEAFNVVKRVMPVHMHASDLACSAALWVGTQGTRFTCGPAASVGSLGTRMTLIDSSEMYKNAPVKPVVVDSGKYKSIGAPGRAITDADKAELQRYVDGINAVFKAAVQGARRLSAIQMNEVATARVFVGKDAVRVGLCDAVCSVDEAYEHLKQTVNSSKPVRRSPGMEGNHPPATESRSSSMPMQITESQLGQLRTFPGAASANADNAELMAFNAATTLQGTVQEQRTRIESLSGQVNTLQSDNAALKAAAGKPMDPELLRDRCSVACERLKAKLESGKITTAQFTLAASALLLAGSIDKDGNLSADAQPNEAMFRKDGKGVCTYEKVFSVFDENKPNGILKDVTRDQPAARTEPGTPSADASKDEKITLQYVNDLRANAGQDALTRAQFDAIYPEYAGK